MILFKIKRRILYFVEENFPAFPLITALTYECGMGCTYCNSSGLDKRHRGEMSLADFSRLLSWMRRQKIRRIMFTGGEPTLHSRFEEITQMCRKEGVFTYLASNCVFSKSTLSAVNKGIKVVFVNCSTPFAFENKQEFLERLSAIKSRLILRINVYRQVEEQDWIIAAAKKLHARLRIGVINPAFASQQDMDTKAVRQTALNIRDFARRCRKEGVYAYLARPIPRCLFSDKEWMEMRQDMLAKSKCLIGHKGNFSCRMIVNPDLSTYGCFNNPDMLTDLVGFGDYKAANLFYKKSFSDAFKNCQLQSEHEFCFRSRRMECFGGCLAYSRSNQVHNSER